MEYLTFANTGRNKRQARDVWLIRCRIDITKQSIKHNASGIYKNLPNNVKNAASISLFKKYLKYYLLQNIETLLM